MQRFARHGASTSAGVHSPWGWAFPFKDGAVDSGTGNGTPMARENFDKSLPALGLRLVLAVLSLWMKASSRCCGTTPGTAALPQSARCQVAWHLSIQSVAPPQRCGLGEPAVTACMSLFAMELSGFRRRRTIPAIRARQPPYCFSSSGKSECLIQKCLLPLLSFSLQTIRSGQHGRLRAFWAPVAILSFERTPGSRPSNGPAPPDQISSSWTHRCRMCTGSRFVDCSAPIPASAPLPP
jgi:hypothetical protein